MYFTRNVRWYGLTGIDQMINFLLFVIAWFLIGCAVAWLIGGASGRCDKGARDK
jgi:hypothetical protein